ncbi:alpha/beta fold hydrolase [Actinoplanes sp. DH11]|uniref:thioesterase domain-containing protein n=1 Tax=Actinoplanes sp. DH11 TaxID=2857011 RepID=UPI001E55450F|nr:alpha/beta fold hydrolase [Actinoplanes sp. DH11]
MTAGFDPVLPLRPNGSRPPLFCVPPVSGSPYVYRALLPLLDEEQPVYTLESPGFDGDEPPLDSVPALAELFLTALRRCRGEGEVALLGWSMGGVVAYEMATRLTALGVAVPLLMVVDAAAPGTHPAPPAGAVARLLARDLAAVNGLPAEPLERALEAASPDAGADDVLAAVAGSGVLPPDCDQDFLRQRLRPFAAHVRALASYRPAGRYPGTVTLIRAEQSTIDRDSWQRISTDLDEYLIPADHYTIWRGDALASLGAAVRHRLDGLRHPHIA